MPRIINTMYRRKEHSAKSIAQRAEAFDLGFGIADWGLGADNIGPEIKLSGRR